MYLYCLFVLVQLAVFIQLCVYCHRQVPVEQDEAEKALSLILDLVKLSKVSGSDSPVSQLQVSLRYSMMFKCSVQNMVIYGSHHDLFFVLSLFDYAQKVVFCLHIVLSCYTFV